MRRYDTLLRIRPSSLDCFCNRQTRMEVAKRTPRIVSGLSESTETATRYLGWVGGIDGDLPGGTPVFDVLGFA